MNKPVWFDVVKERIDSLSTERKKEIATLYWFVYPNQFRLAQLLGVNQSYIGRILKEADLTDKAVLGTIEEKFDLQTETEESTTYDTTQLLDIIVNK